MILRAQLLTYTMQTLNLSCIMLFVNQLPAILCMTDARCLRSCYLPIISYSIPFSPIRCLRAGIWVNSASPISSPEPSTMRSSSSAKNEGPGKPGGP